MWNASARLAGSPRALAPSRLDTANGAAHAVSVAPGGTIKTGQRATPTSAIETLPRNAALNAPRPREPDDDQLGVHLVGDLSQPLRGDADGGAKLSFDPGRDDDLFEQPLPSLLLRLHFFLQGEASSHTPERCGSSVGHVARLGDVGGDQAQVELFREARGHLKRGL